MFSFVYFTTFYNIQNSLILPPKCRKWHSLRCSLHLMHSVCTTPVFSWRYTMYLGKSANVLYVYGLYQNIPTSDGWVDEKFNVWRVRSHFIIEVLDHIICICIHCMYMRMRMCICICISACTCTCYISFYSIHN